MPSVFRLCSGISGTTLEPENASVENHDMLRTTRPEIAKGWISNSQKPTTLRLRRYIYPVQLTCMYGPRCDRRQCGTGLHLLSILSSRWAQAGCSNFLHICDVSNIESGSDNSINSIVLAVGSSIFPVVVYIYYRVTLDPLGIEVAESCPLYYMIDYMHFIILCSRPYFTT